MEETKKQSLYGRGALHVDGYVLAACECVEKGDISFDELYRHAKEGTTKTLVPLKVMYDQIQHESETRKQEAKEARQRRREEERSERESNKKLKGDGLSGTTGGTHSMSGVTEGIGVKKTEGNEDFKMFMRQQAKVNAALQHQLASLIQMSNK